jgi:hypothetical protein
VEERDPEDRHRQRIERIGIPQAVPYVPVDPADAGAAKSIIALASLAPRSPRPSAATSAIAPRAATKKIDWYFEPRTSPAARPPRTSAVRDPDLAKPRSATAAARIQTFTITSM